MILRIEQDSCCLYDLGQPPRSMWPHSLVTWDVHDAGWARTKRPCLRRYRDSNRGLAHIPATNSLTTLVSYFH